MSPEPIAISPGSFAPLTNGHIDIVRRGLGMFDRIVVAVAYNQDKPSGLLTPAERVKMREAAMVRAAKQYYTQDQQATQEWFIASGLPAESWYQITGSK